ncbi:MAG: hypothetical protein V4481_02135 [Patescibacteria group bacterium]
MKKIHAIFSFFYGVITCVALWFMVTFLTQRGFGPFAKSPDEFIFLIMGGIALLFSVYMHWELRSMQRSSANMINVIITSINAILVVIISGVAFSGQTDAGFLLLAWLFVVLGLWLVSLIAGVVSLYKKHS